MKMLPNILTYLMCLQQTETQYNGYSVLINLLENETSIQLIWTSMLFEDADVLYFEH